MNRLDAVIGEECTDHPPLVEHSIIDREMDAENDIIHSILQYYSVVLSRRVRFSARADLITWRTLWELKCTNAITVEHKLQTILYAWLWQVVNMVSPPKPYRVQRTANYSNPREVRLFNIKTGEILRLNASFEEMSIIVVELLKGKYETQRPKTDEEFLENCQAFMDKYVQLSRTQEEQLEE